jgi:hypothetical protein
MLNQQLCSEVMVCSDHQELSMFKDPDAFSFVVEGNDT